MESFKSPYAKYYDIFYSDKNYESECDFLEKIFKKFSYKKPKNILDAGCGTGGHAIPLTRRGYEVTGIDLSKDMIKIAKKKAKKSGLNIKFHVKNTLNLKLNKKFDACICMFAVMDYLLKNKDIQKTLIGIREHLKKNSLFVFDFWNGSAVLNILPSQRIKKIQYKGKNIIRIATPELDSINHINKTTYHCFVIQKNKIIDEFKEKHTVRFFFPEEIKKHLEENGFELLGLYPFLNLYKKPNERIWDLVAISKAV